MSKATHEIWVDEREGKINAKIKKAARSRPKSIAFDLFRPYLRSFIFHAKSWVEAKKVAARIRKVKGVTATIRRMEAY